MGSSRAEIHNEIALTRQRMSETLGELESRIEGKVDRVKARLDVAAVVRDYPWAALGVALVAGAAIAASGADEKAAEAVVDAAREVPDAAKRATTSAVSAVKERFGGDDAGETSAASTEPPKPPLLQRLAARAGDALADALQPHVDRLSAEMRTAAGSLTERLAGTGTPEFGAPRSARPSVGGSGGGEVAPLDGARGDGAEA